MALALALTFILGAPAVGLPGGAGPRPGGQPLATGIAACLLVLWTMAVAADERALGPLGLREPLVAAGAAGLMVGHPTAGWLMGLVLQSVWPGLQPLGGSRQPWAGPGAAVGALWLALLPAGIGVAGFPIAIAAAVAAAWAGIGIEERLRARNDRRDCALAAAPSAERGARLGALIHLGVLECALAGGGVLAGFVILPFGLARALGVPLLDAWGGVDGLERAAAGGAVVAAAGLTSLFALGGFIGGIARRWLTRRGAAPATPRRARDERAETDPTGAAARAPALGARRLWALVALQAGFGNRYMQRSGFLYFLLLGAGATRRAARDQACAEGAVAGAEALADEILRGAPLNTQPIMAAALLGATERALADARREPPPRPVTRLLELGGSLLAQWGDRAIWGAVRPALGFVALACAAPWPAAAAAYAAAALALTLGARVGLYGWGWSAGWGVVRGSRSWVWRRMPGAADRSLAPLAVIAAASVAAALGRAAGAAGGAGAPANLFSLGGASFILGVPLGAALGSRPLSWAWICGAAAVGAAALGRGGGW